MEKLASGIGWAVLVIIGLIVGINGIYYISQGIKHESTTGVIGIPTGFNGVTPIKPASAGSGYVPGAPRNASECRARGGTDTGRGCDGYR